MVKPPIPETVLVKLRSGNLTPEQCSERVWFWEERGHDVSEFRHLKLPKEPSLPQKAVNFTKAATKHVKSGMRTAPEAVQVERLALCQTCELFVKGVCRHKSCGCPMKRKVKWASSRCPLETPKWVEYVPDITPEKRDDL